LPKVNGGYFLNSRFKNESAGDHFSAVSETGTGMSDHTENAENLPVMMAVGTG
jgi:hypothetical protein